MERAFREWLAQKLSSGPKLLSLAIALRVVVFAFLAPVDNDFGHLEVIQYIVQHRALPPVTENSSAFHPPLYHLLAAAFYEVTGTAKGAQFLSLVLSILTLLVLYRLLYKENLIQGEQSRLYAFMLVCFLPQFVLYGLYVSNDTLANFMGAAIILQVARVASVPTAWQFALLGVVVGVALLTKATFLAFLPVLFAFVLFISLRRGQSRPKSVLAAFVFLFLACGLGSYKFVRNYIEVKNPFVSNLDLGFSWVAEQKESYRGAASYYDANLLKLVASPSLSPATEGAYPLLLYGTFWYQHIPESNLLGSRRAPFNYLGSAIYVLALVPTAIFFYGLLILLKRLPRFLGGFDPSLEECRRLLVSYVAVFCFLGNLALIGDVVLKYHVWSVMQGRLLFPSFTGMLVPFGVGIAATANYRFAHAALRWAMGALICCFGAYFASEIAYQVLVHFVPGVKEFLKRFSFQS